MTNNNLFLYEWVSLWDFLWKNIDILPEEVKTKVSKLLEYTKWLEIENDRLKSILDVLYKELDNISDQLSLLAALHLDLIIVEDRDELEVRFISSKIIDEDIKNIESREISANEIIKSKLDSKKFHKLLGQAKSSPWEDFYSNFIIILGDKKYNLMVSFIEKQDKYGSSDKYSIKLILSSEFKKAITSLFSSLIDACKLRNLETGDHLVKSSEYSKLLSKKLMLEWAFQDLKGDDFIDEEFIYNIWLTAPLHDIWKIWIPDSILLKEWKLTSEEFCEMERHTELWSKLIRDLEAERNIFDPLLIMAETIASQHHEKWDWSWYPYGLKWDEIRLEARIVTIIDFFDALWCKRPYKEAWPLEEVKQKMISLRWTHFDPVILDIFLKYWDEFVLLKHKIEKECENNDCNRVA